MRKILLAIALLWPTVGHAQTTYVTKSGQLIIFKLPAPVTAVAGNPVVTINGNTVTLRAPIWDSTQKRQPFVCYEIPQVQANDGITVATPTGWPAKAGTPGPPMPAANFTGQLEPDFVPASRTMKLGANTCSSNVYWGTYTAQANWARRLSNAWSAYTYIDAAKNIITVPIVQTADGWPITLPGGTTQQFIAASAANGIDGQCYPMPTGTWQVLWDDTCPAKPTKVELAVLSNQATATVVASPGNSVGGILKDCSRVYQIGYKPNASNLNLSIYVRLTNATGINTAQNLRVYPPGPAPVDTADPLAVDPSMLALLNGGAKPPAIIRVGTETGASDSYAVDPADLSSMDRFAWGPVSRSVAITAIRPHVLADPTGSIGFASPFAYLHQPAGTATTSPPATAGPFRIAPSSVGWLNYAGAATNNYIAEVVAPGHGLKTGQPIVLSKLPAFPITNNAPTTPPLSIIAQSYKVIPWVTGPDTFAYTSWCNAPFSGARSVPGMINNVAIPTQFSPGSAALSVTTPQLGQLPPAQAAAIAAKVSGAGLMVGIPHGASDRCVEEIARQTRDTLPLGRKVYVEYSNEVWNTQYTENLYVQVMGLQSTPPIGGLQWYTLRASQVHAIFARIFDDADSAGNRGRSGEVVRVFGSQYANTGVTTAILAYAKAQGIRVDALAVAPYLDAPAFLTAPAALLSPAGPLGAGQLGWTMPQYLDLLRHAWLYDSAAASWWAGHNAAIAKYCPGAMLMTYEGGAQSVIPAGAGVGRDAQFGARLSVDAVYHPAFADVEQTTFLAFQRAGVAAHVMLNLCGQRAGQATCYIWPMVTFPGQPAGDGTSNVFSEINGGDKKAHDAVNQSVRLKAWRDWSAVSN